MRRSTRRPPGGRGGPSQHFILPGSTHGWGLPTPRTFVTRGRFAGICPWSDHSFDSVSRANLRSACRSSRSGHLRDRRVWPVPACEHICTCWLLPLPLSFLLLLLSLSLSSPPSLPLSSLFHRFMNAHCEPARVLLIPCHLRCQRQTHTNDSSIKPFRCSMTAGLCTWAV